MSLPDIKVKDKYWLMQGDCLERMKEIPEGNVDMVLTDPPYGTTQNKWDSVLPLDKMWPLVWKCVKSNGAVVMTSQCPFDKVLGASQIDTLKYEWIWEKTEATGHLNAKKQPMKAHENILVWYRGQCLYLPQKTKAAPVRIVQKSANGSDNYGGQRPTTYESDERYPRSVQIVPKDFKNQKQHPTQKPVALMEYLIKTYTNEGDVVLDFTMGSGTTGVACANLGRKFIGIELDEGYFSAAAERIKTAYEAKDMP